MPLVEVVEEQGKRKAVPANGASHRITFSFWVFCISIFQGQPERIWRGSECCVLSKGRVAFGELLEWQVSIFGSQSVAHTVI